MFAFYSSKLGDAVASLPQGAADIARDSIGAAIEVAATLPPAEGLALDTAAKSAFTDAFGLSVILGAGLSLIGVLLLAKFMPTTEPAGHGGHGAEMTGGHTAAVQHASASTAGTITAD